jgi:hypothetical protein
MLTPTAMMISSCGSLSTWPTCRLLKVRVSVRSRYGKLVKRWTNPLPLRDSTYQ